MKIPRSIRINGVDYTIKREPFLEMDFHELAGKIDYNKCEIYISTRLEPNVQIQCLTMWHEILHAIVRNAQLELDDEEKVVEAFALGIYQVLADNAEWLFAEENIGI